MKDRYSILLITLRSDIGGGPKSVLMLSRYLPEDFDIYVASPYDPPYFQWYEKNPRIKEHCELPHRKFSLSYFWKLIRFIRKNNIRIVNSNGTGAGFYARLLKLVMPGIKVVHTFRGVRTKDPGSWGYRLYFFYERLASFLTDHFINVSQGEQKLCVSKGIYRIGRSSVVYNGIEPLDKGSSLPEVKVPENKFIIITLSRFDYPKNMVFAYEVAKAFKDDPEMVFLWVGDGEDRVGLEERAKMEGVNIIFAGNSTQIGGFMSRSNLYLSTSRWEGLPLSLLESSSMGVPMIASNVIGNNEVVVEGVNGLLYEAENLEQAISRIRVLRNDKMMLAGMASESKRIFDEKYSAQNMAFNAAVVFRDLFENKN